MTSKLGGRPTKDAPISDAFNPVKLGPKPTKAELAQVRRAAKLAKKRITEVQQQNARELEKIEAKIDKTRIDLGIKESKPVNEIDTTPEPTADEDEKAAHKMVQDLRYAYRNAVGPTGKRGRSRLMEIFESDTEFKLGVKALLKIESDLMAAKIRKDSSGESQGGVANQNFFVVLKGLEDGPKMIEGKTDSTVDIKQIQRAMNPDMGEVYEAEEVNQRDAPEQLQKASGDGTENW